ncbi:hypothetical protein DPMN_137046 [Dreissena polymorpha]|uniref:Uncharacterized protein n=1 Tax=Dreissena polymorpha TaxID=45954 RepID=A0A9D4G137_DREPO|nr:hypothetical protein DPMN_137046 [Dreissena polymorpha]
MSWASYPTQYTCTNYGLTQKGMKVRSAIASPSLRKNQCQGHPRVFVFWEPLLLS